MAELPDFSWLQQIVLDGDGRRLDGTAPACQAADPEGAGWVVLTAMNVQPRLALAAHLLAHARARPDVGVFYVDELVRDEQGAHTVLKPEFDLTWMLTANYIGLPVCVRSDILARFGGARDGDGIFRAHALLLQAASAGIAIARIPEVLAERTGPLTYDRSLHLQAVARWLGPERPLYEVDDGRLPATLELRRSLANEAAPPLTICITHDEEPGSTSAAVGALVHRLQGYGYPAPIHLIVEMDAPHGPPPVANGIEITVLAPDIDRTQARNAMWRASRHDLVIFLDRRIDLPHQPSWLEPVLAHALQEDVGGCSPILLGRDGATRHAGMAGDRLGLLRRPGREETATSRERSMLCGQALATRRALLDEVQGFDERLGPGLATADLCLRLRMLGLRLVCAAAEPLIADIPVPPVCGPQDSAGAWARFMERWHPFLTNDPCWHPDKP